MITDSLAFYQEKLLLATEVTEVIQQLIRTIQTIDTHFQPDIFFISDYLVGPEREWKHLFLFSKYKIWISYKFLTSNEFELIPLSGQTSFRTQLSVKAFDFHSYNDKSRLSATIQIDKFQLELKATQANCVVLHDILTRWFIG